MGQILNKSAMHNEGMRSRKLEARKLIQIENEFEVFKEDNYRFFICLQAQGKICTWDLVAGVSYK